MSALRGRRGVIVLNWAALGGAERAALALSEYLRDEHGARVEVLALTERTGSARALFLERGFAWHARNLQWHGNRVQKGALLLRLVRELRARRPDVLLPYCTAPNVLCGLTWQLTGAATCIWHQQDVNPSRRFGPRLIRTALDRTPVAVTNSYAARDVLVADWGARPERVQVVLEPVEPIPPVHSRAEWRARLQIGGATVVACMVGHLHDYKDHATLLRAWKELADDDGDRTVLLLAGRDAGAEARLKALAYDLELGRSVRFLGEVGDIGGLLAASDLSVLCSERESAPRAVLEAMAAGLPVAGSDIPGIRELVGDGSARFLAPTGDAGRLAAALRELMGSADLRRSVGAANAKRARERFVGKGVGETAAAAVAEAFERAP